jgi:hypothetical protein
MTNSLEALIAEMKAAAELISGGYSRKWIVSHDDETCWVGENDDDGNLTPFIEVSIGDWSGNKADNEVLAKFIASSHPKNILKLIAALEQAQQRVDELENDEVHQRLANAEHQLHMAELAKYNLKTSRRAQFRKRLAAEERVVELEDLLSAGVTEEAETLRERIAELEARQLSVKLPAGTYVNGFQMLIESEVVAYLQAAGINAEVFRAAGGTVEGSE